MSRSPSSPSAAVTDTPAISSVKVRNRVIVLMSFVMFTYPEGGGLLENQPDSGLFPGQSGAKFRKPGRNENASPHRERQSGKGNIGQKRPGAFMDGRNQDWISAGKIGGGD